MDECYELFFNGNYKEALKCCVNRLEEDFNIRTFYILLRSEIELNHIDLAEKQINNFLKTSRLEQRKHPMILEVQGLIAEEIGRNLNDDAELKKAISFYNQTLRVLNCFGLDKAIYLKKYEIYMRKGDCHLLLAEYKKAFDALYQAFEYGLKAEILSIHSLKVCCACIEKTIGKYKAIEFWDNHKKVIDEFSDDNPITTRLFGEEIRIKFRNGEPFLNIRDFCSKFNQSYKYVCGFVLSEKIYDGRVLKIDNDKYMDLNLLPMFTFRVNTDKIEDEWVRSEIIEYKHECIRYISDVIWNNPEIRREVHDKFPYLSGAPVIDLRSYLKRNFIEPTEDNLEKFTEIARKVYKEIRGVDVIQVLLIDKDKNKLKGSAWQFTELDLEILDKALAEFMA